MVRQTTHSFMLVFLTAHAVSYGLRVMLVFLTAHAVSYGLRVVLVLLLGFPARDQMIFIIQLRDLGAAFVFDDWAAIGEGTTRVLAIG